MLKARSGIMELDCLPKVKGPRVLVKTEETETVSEGGIVLATTTKDKFLQDQAQTVGTLIAAGDMAWQPPVGTGEPWAKPGDKVLYAKFAGYEVRVDGKLYRVMNDEDITATVEEL